MKKIGMSFALVFGLAMQVACTSTESTVEDDKNPPADNTPPGQNPGDPPVNVDPNDPMAAAPQPKPGMAMIRAIHASADAPAVDAYVKGSPTPIVTNLNYGQTSGWFEVPMGTYEIELRAAPSKPTDPIAYKTSPLQVGDQAMISAVASGLLGSSAADSAFRLLPIVEKFDTVPGGQVRVRAIHGGADAPTVDLDIGNDNPAAPEAAGLARFADTGDAGVLLPAGALAIGIAKDGSRVTSFTTPALPSGGQLLVVATGLLAKLGRERDGFSLLAIGPNGSVGFIKQDPIVYALHASPDAPAVDAFVGAAEIFDNLSFGQISKPIQVKPGEYQLDFYGTTAGSARPQSKPAAVGATGQLAAGDRYLAVATGFLGAGSFKLVGLREGFDIKADKAVVRALHASPDAPAVDIGVVNGSHQIQTVLFSDLTFGKSSDEKGAAADAGHIPLGVAPTGAPTPVAAFTLPATNGQRAFVVAAGALAPTGDQRSFRLLVVDTALPAWTATAVFPH
jgi:hypothetical protein